MMDGGTPESTAGLEDGKNTRRAWVESIRGRYDRFYDAGNCQSDAIPIHPARVITELRRVMPRETICLVDSGAHRAFCGHYWESYGPREYISATTIGPMGWAITGGYAAVAEAMEYVLSYRSIPDKLQQELAGMYGVTGVIEIVVLCGFYQLIGEVNASFDVPLPPECDGDQGPD
jgi:glyoxylate carboligase